MSTLPTAEYFFYLGGFFILFFLIYYRRRSIILSPLNFFFFFYGIIFFLSLIYHLTVPPSIKFNYYILDNISWKSFWFTNLVFLKMLFFFSLGTFLYTFYSKRIQKLNRCEINFFIDFSTYKSLQAKLFFLMTISTIFAVVFTMFDFGWEIFDRKRYIPYQKSYWRLIYQILYLGSSLLAGLIFKRNKLFSLAVLFLCVFFMLSVGSRFATINLVAFGLGVLISIKNSKKRLFFGLLYAVFVFLFFGLNLGLRTESKGGHGTIPYIEAVIEKPLFFLDYALENAYYTLIFGFYVTRKTISMYEPDWMWLYTSLTPLPGSLTSWSEIANRLRVNIYCPFNAIGELYVYGYFFYIYFFILGIYFAFIDFSIKKMILRRHYFSALLQFAFLALFTIFTFEYNLRSSNRYLYYSLFLLFLYYVFNKIKLTNAKSKK